MINLNGYDEVSSGGKSLPPNAYIAKILAVRIGLSSWGVDSLFVNLDIADGDFADYFKRQTLSLKSDTWSNYGTLTIPLYDNGKPHWKLKKFLEVVKHDNPDLNIISNTDFNERYLIGKYCGIVVGLKESQKRKNDGSHWINPYISYAITIGDVRSGNFKIPEFKKISAPTSSAPPDKEFPNSTPVDPDNIPF